MTLGRLRLSVADARDLAEGALRGIGYRNDEARIIADHVIDAAMCGYEYSGLAKILNVPESEHFRLPRRSMKVLQETEVSLAFDGGNNVGMLALFQGAGTARRFWFGCRERLRLSVRRLPARPLFSIRPCPLRARTPAGGINADQNQLPRAGSPCVCARRTSAFSPCLLEHQRSPRPRPPIFRDSRRDRALPDGPSKAARDISK
jgi:hypothetical protein